MRWQVESDGDGDDSMPAQSTLFAPEPSDAVVERRPGQGAFRGMEFLHVRARSIINSIGPSPRLPFRHTINAYRGCSHACTYCLWEQTPVLLADGRTKAISDLKVGDEVYGTQRRGAYRRYVRTPVLAHWTTVKPAYRVLLADGTELIASADHRFLTVKGWKFVTGSQHGRGRRPHLAVGQSLMGIGAFALAPPDSPDYRRGYLCGLIKGDGHLGSYQYTYPKRSLQTFYRFRLALIDLEPLQRATRYLQEEGVPTDSFLFQGANAVSQPMSAIRTQKRSGVEAIQSLVTWPERPSDDWSKGFLSGIFDAEGSYSRGILRIANTDNAIIEQTVGCLRRFAFDAVVETTSQRNDLCYVRVRHGLREHLRFFHTVDTAITRKRAIDNRAVKGDADLRILAIEPVGLEMPMFDITTGTGDFIANGVVSHNCFARPSHEWLELDIDEGFERQVVVKINAVERLRVELAPRRWAGEPIAMGTNTDPYQRCEGIYGLTRGLIQVLAERRNPFSILTKSTLVLRDLDVLAEASRRADVGVNLSIGTLDPEVWRATEPGTPHPLRRVEAIARLRAADVRCGVLVAPVLPGLSDSAAQLDSVVAACAEAGASSISGGQVVYLKPGTREVFLTHLARTHPHLVGRYEQLYQRVNAPSELRRQVQQRLRDAIARHQGRHVAITRNRAPQQQRTPRPAMGPSTGPTPEPTQLGLPLCG